MAFIPVPNTALVEMKFFIGSTIAENTLWFENIVSPTAEMLETLATNCAAAWGSNLSIYQIDEVSLFEVKATSMASETAPTFSYSLTPPTAGTIDDNRMPGSITWVISFRTALRGRSFRGRNYWVGLGESQVSGDSITSTLANNILTGYADFMLEAELDGWDHVVVSKFSGGSPRAAGVTTPVTSYGYADLFVDSQRRRLAGRGS